MEFCRFFKKETNYQKKMRLKFVPFRQILNGIGGGFTESEVKAIASFSLACYAASKNPSPAIIISTIMRKFPKIDSWRALGIFVLLRTNEVIGISGGDGDSLENCFVVLTNRAKTGILTEYAMLFILFGIQDKDWKLIDRVYLSRGFKNYQHYEIEKNGEILSLYIDNSLYFNKRRNLK